MSGNRTATQTGRRSFYRDESEGIIISVGPVIALVQPVGSSHSVPCQFDVGSGASVGKRCTFKWIPQRKSYFIQSVFGRSGTIVSPDQSPPAFELSPPSNLVHDDSLPNCILLRWDCPPQQDITFQVQYNATATDVGASDHYTRAGEAVIPTTDDPTWFRIRSITEGWRYSSWTDWGSESPGTGAAGGGDSDAIHDNVAGEIHAITEKASPVSADEIVIEDSAASYAKKRVQIGNLPGGSGTDDDAIHDNVSNEIGAITEKTTPVDDDIFIIEDSESSYVKKRLKLSNIPTGGDGVAFDLYSQYGTTEIESTTSETDIFHASSFIGSKTLEAGFFIAGKVLVIDILGGIATDTVAGTFTFKLKLSSVAKIQFTFNLPDNVPFGRWHGRAYLICTSTGTSGGCTSYMNTTFSDGADDIVVLHSLGQYSGGTINTTTSHAMTCTGQLSDSDDYISTTLFTIRYIDPTAVTGSGGGGSGDMTKAVYDTDNDGIVNEAAVADYVDWSNIDSIPSTFAPSGHHTSHEAGGTDIIKLDDLAATDDNTDLDSSTSAHGLLPKLSGDSGEYLDGTGAFSTPGGGMTMAEVLILGLGS